MDPRYGMPYYFNAGTGQRQWQKPGAELPPGWQEARDPRSGLPYFFNLATGQRVWEHPGRSAASALLCGPQGYAMLMPDLAMVVICHHRYAHIVLSRPFADQDLLWVQRWTVCFVLYLLGLAFRLCRVISNWLAS